MVRPGTELVGLVGRLVDDLALWRDPHRRALRRSTKGITATAGVGDSPSARSTGAAVVLSRSPSRPRRQSLWVRECGHDQDVAHGRGPHTPARGPAGGGGSGSMMKRLRRRRSRMEGKKLPRRSLGMRSTPSPALVANRRSRAPLRHVVRPGCAGSGWRRSPRPPRHRLGPGAQPRRPCGSRRVSPPAPIASSNSVTSDLVRVTGFSLQLALVIQPRCPGVPPQWWTRLLLSPRRRRLGRAHHVPAHL